MGDSQVRSHTRLVGSTVKALTCAAALIAVTASAGCGGGSQKPAVLATTGAAANTSSSAGPSTSAATSSAAPSVAPSTSAPATSASASGAGDYAAFPGFTPPADLKDIFDPTPSTGDPVKDKILADDVQVQRAFDVWSVTGNFNAPGISTYLGTGIYGEYQAQTVQYHASGKVPSGVTRYYNRRVVALDSKAARVIDCEDGRQAHDKDTKTGQAVPGSSDGIVAITTTYVKNSAGVYQAQMSSKEANPALCPVS